MAGGSVQSAIYRVGVMDFSNLSKDKDQDWVAEAFTSSVADKLQRISSFTVLSREHLWRVQGKVDRQKATEPERAQTFATDTRLDYLVFGSVQRAGDLKAKDAPLRVHARMVDTVRGVIHQAVVVDGKMSELFDLQYRLAEAFVEQATIEISLAERQAMRSPEALSLEAYRLFNIGMIEKMEKRYEKAIQAFEEAMARHPGILYGDAHHQIGLVYLAMGRNAELLTRFKADVVHLAPVYYDLGVALRQSGQYKKAADAFKTFVESTDRVPYLWEHDLMLSESQVLLDPGASVVVVSSGQQLLALDALTGKEVWQKNQEAGTVYSVQAPSLLVSDLDRNRAIDMNSGNLILKQDAQKIRLKEAKQEDYRVLISQDQLVVRDQDRSLWVYKTQKGEKLLGHNRQVLFVREGGNKLKAIEIQKESLPSQLDGLLQLAQCLELGEQPEQAKEVYDYLMDLGSSRTFPSTQP